MAKKAKIIEREPDEEKADDNRNLILDCEDALHNAKTAFEAKDYKKAARELNALKERADFAAAEVEELA